MWNALRTLRERWKWARKKRTDDYWLGSLQVCHPGLVQWPRNRTERPAFYPLRPRHRNLRPSQMVNISNSDESAGFQQLFTVFNSCMWRNPFGRIGFVAGTQRRTRQALLKTPMACKAMQPRL